MGNLSGFVLEGYGAVWIMPWGRVPVSHSPPVTDYWKAQNSRPGLQKASQGEAGAPRGGLFFFSFPFSDLPSILPF